MNLAAVLKSIKVNCSVLENSEVRRSDNDLTHPSHPTVQLFLEMFSPLLWLSLLLVLVISSSAATEFQTDPVERTLTQFFNMFVVDCEEWVSTFSVYSFFSSSLAPSFRSVTRSLAPIIPPRNATFNHPKFPGGVTGRPALMSMCTKLQGPGQSFRQDGIFSIFISFC